MATSSPQPGTKGKFRVYNIKTGKVREFKTMPKLTKGKFIVTDLNWKENPSIVAPQNDPPGGCPTGCRCTYLGGGTWLVEC